jgi:SWI/SNF-related matrix-associated actin-dependent regulator of chromatin subfamily A member 5
LQSLRAEYRLLLTGTPLQNNLSEMHALLHWLYPDVFTEDTGANFKQAFDLTKGRVSTSFMNDARTLLELIMLRRMKTSPGVNLGLPPKEEILLYVPLTPMQRFWYTRLITKDSGMLETLFKGAKDKEIDSLQQDAEADMAQSLLLKKAGDELSSASGPSDVWAETKEIMEKAVQNEEVDTNSSEWRKLMNLVMQLRKVCSHPYILPGAQPDPYTLGEHVVKASGKFIVLSKLIDELVVKNKKKVLIFSGFTSTLNLVEDLMALKGANTLKDASFRYLRLDGGTCRARRNLGIRMFNDPKSDYKVMLISTRAGGLGVNLASASDVVFMDEDWNPTITQQAEARAHRIGQIQKVTIYKLCSQGTVEEQMQGRIRKKLYLSAKITESMRSIHAGKSDSKKRKRSEVSDEEDAPQLDAGSLKSLIRRGAQTLSRPEVDITEMLKWDWDTTIENCKDKPMEQVINESADDEVAEESWLSTMEKVETAVFEGKKHQKQVEQDAKATEELNRADRRVGKNTTVEIDGFAINKESLNCNDWEAVPTLSGKGDTRLQEPPKAKKARIENTDFCQHCWEGGDLVCCSGCPRSHHIKCLSNEFKAKAKAKFQFYCPAHECRDCLSKTSDAGGLIYRCRWCMEGSYCEDCLDWENTKLLGETLPEYEMLGYPSKDNAYFIECSSCIASWTDNAAIKAEVEKERNRIDAEYETFLSATETPEKVKSAADTPETLSEVGTPVNANFSMPAKKKARLS